MKFTIFALALVFLSIKVYAVDKKYEFSDLKYFINKAPGVAVLVVKNGKTILKNGYGLANIEKKIKITEETIFESGSVAKMFTSAAIIKLHEKGMVDLKKPAKYYLSSDFDFLSPKITVENLIFHTSGIPDYLNDKSLNLNKKVNSDIFIDNDFVFKYLKSKRVNNKDINAIFNYSNTNYVLLSMIIENISKKSYKNYMKEDIFDDVKMDSFIHEAGRLVDDRESISYSEWPNFKILKNKTNYITTGDFGIQISINDFEKWIQFIQNNNYIWNKYQTHGYVLQNGKVMQIDYGYGMRFGKIDGIDCLFHRGYINGASNIFVYNKELDTFVVILSNTSSVFTDNLAGYILREIEKSDTQQQNDKQVNINF